MYIEASASAARPCRDQTYSSRSYDDPPTIDNASQHPFTRLHCASAAAGPSQASVEPSAGPSSTVAKALGSRSSAPAAAPLPPGPKPVEAAPASSSFDLLSLDDVRPGLLL